MTSILLYVFRRHATKLQIFTIDHVPERHRPLNVKSLRMGQLNWDLARCSFVNYSLRLLFIIYYSRFHELSHFEKHFFFLILFVIIWKKKFKTYFKLLFLRFSKYKHFEFVFQWNCLPNVIFESDTPFNFTDNYFVI